jgi:hypothetical protein
VTFESIEWRILVIRGQRVMLDGDLAALYRVSTKRLNEQVKRNSKRFPEDFMFQLTEEESKKLDHIPAANEQHGGRRYRPYAFTEQGAGMLASVLRSPVSTKVSVEILRAFGRLRQDEEPPPASPYERPVRSLFAAIRDAVLFLPGDERYTTSEPFTYFLQAGTEGPIKIGSTRNLLVRLRTLYAMSPLPLKLLGVMKGEVAEERCHIRLGAFRLHGEWFAPSPVILDFISENATSPNIVARLIGQGQNGRG